MKNEKLIEQVYLLENHIFKIFPSDHQCFNLVKMIIDLKPTEEFPFDPAEEVLRTELFLTRREISALFLKLDEGINSFFIKNEGFDVAKLPTLEIPVIGSSLIFKVNAKQSFVVKIDRDINLDVNCFIKPYLHFEVLGDNYYKVISKVIEMEFNGIIQVYILKQAG